jgi:hypothetical protein
MKEHYCKQGWQDDGGGFKKCDILSALWTLKIYWKNAYHSKTCVRNHTPQKCVLETITAVTVTRDAALSLSLFVSTVPKNIDALVTYCHQLKRILKKSGYCICNHFRTAPSTSPLSWNLWPFNRCLHHVAQYISAMLSETRWCPSLRKYTHCTVREVHSFYM